MILSTQDIAERVYVGGLKNDHHVLYYREGIVLVR